MSCTSTRSKLLETRHWPPTLDKTFLETCDALLLGIEERDQYAPSLSERERENTDQWRSQGEMAEGGRGEQGAPCVRTRESAAHKLHGFSPRSAGCENGEEGGDSVRTPLSASRSFASPYFSLAPNTGGEAWRQGGCDEGAAVRCPDLCGSLPSLFLPPPPLPLPGCQVDTDREWVISPVEFVQVCSCAASKPAHLPQASAS